MHLFAYLGQVKTPADFSRTNKKIISFLFFCCVLQPQNTVLGQTGTDLKSLKTKLFVTDSYDSKVRPVTDQSNTVQVRMRTCLIKYNLLVQLFL